MVFVRILSATSGGWKVFFLGWQCCQASWWTLNLQNCQRLWRTLSCVLHASQADFLKCQEVFLKDDMDFEKLAGYVWSQDTPRLLQQERACMVSLRRLMVEALSQAQAGAVPFMKIPSALRSVERAAGLPSASVV